ncbi:hypothetical protein ACNUDN_03090 [Mycobacterium sp. smrl_JER01]
MTTLGPAVSALADGTDPSTPPRVETVWDR